MAALPEVTLACARSIEYSDGILCINLAYTYGRLPLGDNIHQDHVREIKLGQVRGVPT